MGELGNSENNARFTLSGNPLNTFLMSKYYLVINKYNIYWLTRQFCTTLNCLYSE